MRVMVIGASNDREKFGNKAVRAYLRQGHIVFPVNPTEDSVEGIRCYHAIADVPGPIDRATIYVPPAIGETLLPQLASRGDIKEVWLNPGAESDQVLAAAARAGIEPIQACSIVDIGERP
ncbi:Trans-feruloyl-CoA synthase FCS1 [Phycisphaerales bacterium]|nr:Trans-feruloyl-CoA synthase FCS1 [Phycisphaerales bacterium]